jgi:hypothetical protein
MRDHVIVFSPDEWNRMSHHLIRKAPSAEEALFVISRAHIDRERLVFDPIHLELLTEYDYAYRSLYGFELTDECRGRIIKLAHDLNGSLLEFHSHPLSFDAEFSPSDLAGFEEFVPHVHWRLKGKPYAAVVVAQRSFDSFVWVPEALVHESRLAIEVGSKLIQPSRLTEMKGRS